MRRFWRTVDDDTDESGDAFAPLLAGACPDPEELSEGRAQLIFERALADAYRPPRGARLRGPLAWALASVAVVIAFVVAGNILARRVTPDPHSAGTALVVPPRTIPRAETNDENHDDLRHAVGDRRRVEIVRVNPREERKSTRQLRNRTKASPRIAADLHRTRNKRSFAAPAPDSLSPLRLTVTDAPASRRGFARASATTVSDRGVSRTSCVVEGAGVGRTKITVARAEAGLPPARLTIETTADGAYEPVHQKEEDSRP